MNDEVTKKTDCLLVVLSHANRGNANECGGFDLKMALNQTKRENGGILFFLKFEK